MADHVIQTTYPELLWAGTQHSFHLAAEAHSRVIAASGGMPDDEDDDEPYNFSLQGDVGIIQIKGSLTNRDSPWNKYYGVTSYGAIREAMIYAANMPEVKAILLDIDSGGGAVNGVSDTGDLISMIDKKVKPVYAVTDGTMASAAYWLGSSARKVYASKLSLVGSIGVITTHTEYSKALKEAGINVTVLRAGKYKALVNSVEPLTKDAIEKVTAQLEVAYGVFLNHVASMRGVTVDTADTVMAQGREFMGEAAVGAGLIDGLESFDSLLSKISSEILDTPKVTQSQYGHHISNAAMTKTALTEQQIAAIQAGVDLTAVGAVADAAAAAAAAQATADAATAAAAAALAAAAPAATTLPTESAVVALLTQQLEAAQTAAVNLRVELAQAKTAVESMTASQAGLKQIVSASLSTMRVALNLGKVDMSAMAVDALVAEHSATSAQFTSTFKAGGVAAPSSSEEVVQTAVVDPAQRQRVLATRYPTK